MNRSVTQSAPQSKPTLKLALLALTLLFFTACSSVNDAPELESAASTQKLWTRVASDQDDAEERASGKVVTSSTDLELTVDTKRGQQLVGVRFKDLDIPQGATVKYAYVRFSADEADRGALKLKLQGDDSDSAARFEEKSRNLSSRKRTSASVTWQPADWRKVGEHGGKQRTPNLAPLLQEVVSRKGWQPGNDFALLISSQSKSAKRVAESYRGDRKNAPLLYVEYTTTSAGPSAPAPSPAPEPVAKSKSVLYVSPSKGSDKNDGRSIDKPLKTLYQMSKVVKPGDTVYLRGGVYKGFGQSYFGYDRKPFSVDGKKNARITIMSYPGEEAIIDGSKRHYKNFKSISSPALFEIRADYYTVQNITLRHGAGRGLYFKGDHNIARNILTYDHHSDGIYIVGDHNLAEDFVSHSNYSKQNGGDSADGIKIAFGERNVVRNCNLYNNSDDGIDIWGTSNTLIEYCVAHHNGRGYSGNGQGFKLGGNHTKNNKAVARYNIGYNNRTNNFDSNGSGGVTMVHNTSWGAGRHGFVANKPSSKHAPNVVKNNISYQDKKAKGMTRKDISRYNSWDLKINDPKFVSLNPKSKDFLKLRSNSQAIDAGTKLDLPFQGSAPDLGALEGKQSIASLLGNIVIDLEGGLQLAGR